MSKEFAQLLKPIKQEKPFSCGPASLTMLLNCYGFSYKEKDLVRELDVTEEGVDWWSIVEYLENRNLDYGYATKAPYRELHSVYKIYQAPILIAWNPTHRDGYDHFSVVREVTANRIILADPAIGQYVDLGRDDFENHWYGGGKIRPYLYLK